MDGFDKRDIPAKHDIQKTGEIPEGWRKDIEPHYVGVRRSTADEPEGELDLGGVVDILTEGSISHDFSSYRFGTSRML